MFLYDNFVFCSITYLMLTRFTTLRIKKRRFIKKKIVPRTFAGNVFDELFSMHVCLGRQKKGSPYNIPRLFFFPACDKFNFMYTSLYPNSFLKKVMCTS